MYLQYGFLYLILTRPKFAVQSNHFTLSALEIFLDFRLTLVHPSVLSFWVVGKD
jgi:hypothetical protein